MTAPEDQGYTQVNLFAHWIGRFLMWLLGWRVLAEPLPRDKFVLIGAPHTSNTDFFFMLTTSWVLRLKLHFIGKHTLFKPPLGWVLGWLGGIPVDRRARHGAVEQIAERIKTEDQFILVIAPSGTRKQTDHWKSGFYWIASLAKVPIVCGALDYKHKQVRLGLNMIPTGNVPADMDRIRDFFLGTEGRFPHKQTPIRLREESA